MLIISIRLSVGALAFARAMLRADLRVRRCHLRDDEWLQVFAMHARSVLSAPPHVLVRWHCQLDNLMNGQAVTHGVHECPAHDMRYQLDQHRIWPPWDFCTTHVFGAALRRLRRSLADVARPSASETLSRAPPAPLSTSISGSCRPLALTAR